MSLVSLVITLIVVGVLLWVINNYIPMDGKIKETLGNTPLEAQKSLNCPNWTLFCVQMA
jgi:hypothetical protein